MIGGLLELQKVLGGIRALEHAIPTTYGYPKNTFWYVAASGALFRPPKIHSELHVAFHTQLLPSSSSPELWDCS